MLDLSARRVAWLLAPALWACGADYAYKPPSCKTTELVKDGGCVADFRKISLDSVGYLPTRAKAATLVNLDTFQVKRADGSVALSGNPTGPITADTGESVKIADFTSLTEPGEYYVEATGPDGVVSSPHFRIGADVFDEPLRLLLIAMYGQRCGDAVRFDYGGQTFSHEICHQNDAYADLLTQSSTIRPSLRGWHDAGDYGKYVTNAAFSVGLFFKAWEHFPDVLRNLNLPIPEHGGVLPDFLAEMKWELEWLLSAQLEDGTVSHKLTSFKFEGVTTPEGDTTKRYSSGVSTAATAEVAAIMAMANRIFKPYDPEFAMTCLAAARLSYEYIGLHPNSVLPDLSKYDSSSGPYTVNDNGPRLWAAAEMFETTGDAGALKEAETRILSRTKAMNGRKPKGAVDSEWDWGNPDNIGIYTYLMSSRAGRDSALVEQIRAKNQENADGFASAAASHAYGRAGIGYYWGANGTVARIAMNLQIAYYSTGNARYLDAAIRQIDYLFGRNYYARSQVTGLGDKPPLHPHHRPSIMMQRPWPGLLVGGGNPGPTSWVDDQDLFEQNEVAINWNAALVYALAGFASGTNEGTSFYAGPFPGGLVDAGAPDAAPPLQDGAPGVDADLPDASTDVSVGSTDAPMDPDATSDAPTSLVPDAADEATIGD